MLTLEGTKISLREFTRENLHDPAYFKWLRDLEVVANIYRVEYLLPLSFKEVRNYIESVLKSKNDYLFAIYAKNTNKFIGTLKLGHVEWRSGLADVGILIGDKKYWGKGLAKDSIATACDYAFNKLSLRKLTAGTPGINIAMCKCFSTLGFKTEGKLEKQLLLNGEYVDHVLFGLLKTEYQKKRGLK